MQKKKQFKIRLKIEKGQNGNFISREPYIAIDATVMPYLSIFLWVYR